MKVTKQGSSLIGNDGNNTRSLTSFGMTARLGREEGNTRFLAALEMPAQPLHLKTKLSFYEIQFVLRTSNLVLYFTTSALSIINFNLSRWAFVCSLPVFSLSIFARSCFRLSKDAEAEA